MDNNKDLQLNTSYSAKFYLFAVIIGLTLALIKTLTLSSVGNDANVFISYAIPQVSNILAFFILCKFLKTKPSTFVPLKVKVSPIPILLAFVVAIGLFAQNLLLSCSFQWAVAKVGSSASVSVPGMDNATNIILGILIICIFPALGEEVIFRGVTLTSYKSKNNKVFAVLMCGLIFALMHGNIVQLLHQFILGVILAYIAIQTDNILYGVIIHFTNNILALFLPTLIPAFNNICGTPSWINALIMLGIMVGGILILYPSLYFLIKFDRKNVGIVKDPRIIAFFSSKGEKVCYNNTIEGKDFLSEKIWLIIFFVYLIINLIISTISTFPQIAELIPFLE